MLANRGKHAANATNPTSRDNPSDERFADALQDGSSSHAKKRETLQALHRTFVDPSQPVKTCFAVPLYHFPTTRLQQLWDAGIKPTTNRSGINFLKVAVRGQVAEPGSEDDLASYLFRVRADLEALMVKARLLQDGWESAEHLRAIQGAVANHRDAIARLGRLYKVVYREEWQDPLDEEAVEMVESPRRCACRQVLGRNDGEREKRTDRW